MGRRGCSSLPGLRVVGKARGARCEYKGAKSAWVPKHLSALLPLPLF